MFWYNNEIETLEKQSLTKDHHPATLFYGSSTIRLWPDLPADFKDFDAVNLGFGGSTLAACTWFFDRVMQEYQPKRLVLYAGDNDLGDGRHPEEVFIFFQQFAQRVKTQFGELPCYYISLKPSIARWGIVDRFKFTNSIIKTEIEEKLSNWQFINVFDAMLNSEGFPVSEYYMEDGLHLSEKGYLLWKEIVRAALVA